MNSIGEVIRNTRKIKGFSQEELSNASNVNLRTIQRLENNENEPRGKTLSLICDVLEIDVKELMKKHSSKEQKSIGVRIINWIFLIILNVLLISIIGYLVLDSRANWNSRLGGFLFSFFIPYFIVSLTKKMQRMERLLKFGLGFIFYIIFSNVMVGMHGVTIFLLTPCLLIACGTLYFGNTIIKLSD